MPIQNAVSPLRRIIIKSWFLLDAIVALTPPIYWAADGRTPMLIGIPAALFYFLAVGICITSSLIAAYLLDDENARGAA